MCFWVGSAGTAVRGGGGVRARAGRDPRIQPLGPIPTQNGGAVRALHRLRVQLHRSGGQCSPAGNPKTLTLNPKS